MQRCLDLLRNLYRSVQVRRQELVRELTRTCDRVSVRNAAGDVVNHHVVGLPTLVLEDVVTQQRVQVHSQCLRTHLSGNRLPDEWRLGRVGQQVPTNLQVARDQRLSLGRVGRTVGDQRLKPPPASQPPLPEPTCRLACPSANRTARVARYPSGVGRAIRSTSRRLGSLPIEADINLPVDALVQPTLERSLQRRR